jgi:hypothetical protein
MLPLTLPVRLLPVRGPWRWGHAVLVAEYRRPAVAAAEPSASV